MKRLVFIELETTGPNPIQIDFPGCDYRFQPWHEISEIFITAKLGDNPPISHYLPIGVEYPKRSVNPDFVATDKAIKIYQAIDHINRFTNGATIASLNIWQVRQFLDMAAAIHKRDLQFVKQLDVQSFAMGILHAHGYPEPNSLDELIADLRINRDAISNQAELTYRVYDAALRLSFSPRTPTTDPAGCLGTK